MATMKAVQVTKADGPFEVVERDIPEPHDVTRAVEAAYRRDAMNEPPPEPGA